MALPMLYEKPWFDAFEGRWYEDYRNVDFPDNPLCSMCRGHTIITRHRIRDADMNWRYARYMCRGCGYIFEEEILPRYEYLLIESWSDRGS